MAIIIDDDWLPTSENVNRLPFPLRKYIHDLETNCDPQFLVQQVAFLSDQVKQLECKVRILKGEPTTLELDLNRSHPLTKPLPKSLLRDPVRMPATPEGMWTHWCSKERCYISVAFGEECNWCGVRVGKEEPKKFIAHYEVTGNEHSPDWHSMEIMAHSREEAARIFRSKGYTYYELNVEPSI